MPWPYAQKAGIVKKWADKYGISIEVTQFNDYVESINQYTAGAYDAVTVTNMDACFELAASVSRIITPARADASVSSRLATRAMICPSPVIGWYM